MRPTALVGDATAVWVGFPMRLDVTKFDVHTLLQMTFLEWRLMMTAACEKAVNGLRLLCDGRGTAVVTPSSASVASASTLQILLCLMKKRELYHALDWSRRP